MFAFSAVAVALYLALSAARAADSPAQTIALQPGDNLVGWVAEPKPVTEVFAEIPETSLIYHWDAEERRWAYAIRGVGGNLETLEPGMAVTVRVGGDQTVSWERPLTPAKGGITLYLGVNWVTWLGRDEWPLDQVARGIGKSLVSIRVDDETWAAPIDDDEGLPSLSRGDAVEVVVNRDLKWLQPTGMMPEVVFVGDVPESTRDAMTGEIRELLDYFADTHAVETDFSDTAILIWHTPEDAVMYQDSNPPYPFHRSGEALRIALEHDLKGGQTAWGMFVYSGWWTPNPQESNFKRFVMHEWIHYLQVQYTHFWRIAGKPPLWILEGTAVWSGDLGIRIADGHQTFAQTRRSYLSDAARTSVTLRSTEERNTPWQYLLGLLAVDLLVERSGKDSIVEYFRLQHPQPVDSERQWQSTPRLADVFDTAFGLEIGAFSSLFEEWRGNLLHSGQRYDYGPDDRTLHGTLTYANGVPAAGFWITTAPYLGPYKSGRIRRTHVREDGSFNIDLLPDTTQRLSVTNDRCTIWLTYDGLTANEPAADDHRLLDTRDLVPLHLSVPVGACNQDLALTATVLTSYGQSGPVEVGVRHDDFFAWMTRQSYGSFITTVPSPGAYKVLFRVGYCDMYYHPTGLVATRDEAEAVKLGARPVSVSVKVPPDLCVRQIRGRINTIDSTLLTLLWLTATGAGGSGGDHLKARADFSITIPQPGKYRLGFTVDGCRIYYSTSGPTTDWRQATSINVTDTDVSGIEFVVPSDPASLCR